MLIKIAVADHVLKTNHSKEYENVLECDLMPWMWKKLYTVNVNLLFCAFKCTEMHIQNCAQICTQFCMNLFLIMHKCLPKNDL